MDQIFYTLAALACPVGMGAMMWLMMRPGKRKPEAARSGASEVELAELRADLSKLRASQPVDAEAAEGPA